MKPGDREGATSLRAPGDTGAWVPTGRDARVSGVADVPISFSAPQELSKRFTEIRKTKGDGNCFYRALGYSYLESLLGKSRDVLR